MNTQLYRREGYPELPSDERKRISLRTTKISKPSERLLLGESSYMLLDGWYTTMAPNGWAIYPHNSTMNILYLDGHVGELRYKETSDNPAMQKLFGKIE
jgi:prepilin-type processing-associated H-X9-DG protein